MYNALFRWSCDGFVECRDKCVTTNAISGLVPNIRYRRDPMTIWNRERSSGLTGSLFARCHGSTGSPLALMRRVLRGA